MRRRRFLNSRAEAYVRAVEALEALLEELGQDAARRAYAEVIWKAKLKLYQRSRGVELAEDVHTCLHELKGHLCPIAGCHSPEIIPGQSHTSQWAKDGRPHVIVSQPYDFSFETMKETVRFCEAHRLRADVSAELAWHFPGAVVMVEYTRAS
jgi:hypothetical protein